MNERILVLLGPTAVGKTAVSISLAKRLDAEIVSADSIQVYRGLDIGSAKPSLEERQGVKHHLLDITDVGDARFSVAEFRRLADQCIADITARRRLPLVVGGTGLYVNALTYPLQFTSVPGNETIRVALQAEEREKPGSLYHRLQEIDPTTADRLHPNDSKRIVRALEVYEASGRTLSSYGDDFANKSQEQPPYRAVIAGLTMRRDMLYARIEQRVDEMMRIGLLEEARSLYEAGYADTLPALQGLGYKQLLRYLKGQTTLEEAIEEIKRETRRFAKRQFTWFKRDERIRWFDVEEYPQTSDLINAIAEYFQKSIQQDDGEEGQPK
ncbi:MAG: tRNA (adenosine(37)-N6)-dimethylallyltransferase MiaA [Bacillota bacterium]